MDLGVLPVLGRSGIIGGSQRELKSDASAEPLTQRGDAKMSPSKLTDKEIAAKIEDLKGWSLAQGKLHRVFEFGDFVQAFSFMTGVALAAEAMNHHPDWSNSWNRVTIELSTHSTGGLTQNDFDLAAKIQKIAGR
jgi:4a-hydroxytetrahydrobiopterin dehydratase